LKIKKIIFCFHVSVDYTRVSLSEITGIPGSDYINANYFQGASGSHAYIASQGPLAHTVIDFWRMVIECDVQVKHYCIFPYPIIQIALRHTNR